MNAETTKKLHALVRLCNEIIAEPDTAAKNAQIIKAELLALCEPKSQTGEMLITLQMMVGDQRAFCLEARMPDSLVDKETMASTKVNACFDLAEEQIKEARGFIGDMPIGRAPVIEHNFHVKKRGKKAGQRKEGKRC